MHLIFAVWLNRETFTIKTFANYGMLLCSLTTYSINKITIKQIVLKW